MRTTGRIWLITGLLAMIALSTVSCDQATEPGGGGDTASFTGTWNGTLSVSTTDPGGCGGAEEETFGVILVLSQSDTTVTGTIDFLDDPDAAEPFPMFTVSGGTGTADFGAESCSGTPGGTANILAQLTLNGTTITFTVSGTSCRGCPSGSGNEGVGTISGGGTLTRQ